jgi:hypothetical protein
MTIKQENRLKMYLALRIFLKLNKSITDLLPNYNEFFADLDKAIVQIQTNSEQQQYNTKGITGNKKQWRDNLIRIAGDASRKIQAYAKYANNIQLLNETRFSDSDLKIASDIGLIDLSRGLYSRIETHIASLAAYGLTAATQPLFLEAIDTFDLAIPQRKQSQVSKKENTTLINEGFVNADTAIDQIDTLVEIVRLSQAVFYANYRATHKVTDAASSSLSVKGKISDSLAGSPIKDATLSFCLDGNKEVIMQKKTAAKGGFLIKSLAEGEYTVTISKVGYQTLEIPVVVSSSELCEINASLQKK